MRIALSRFGMLLSWMILIHGGHVLADTQVPGGSVDWKKPVQTVSVDSARKQLAQYGVLRAQQRHIVVAGDQGGAAMLPGAAGPPLGLVYHRTIKCHDKPRPPKIGC